MHIQFVAKKVEGKYEGALVVDGKFQRSASGDSIETLFDRFVEPLINAVARRATDVVFTAEMEIEKDV